MRRGLRVLNRRGKGPGRRERKERVWWSEGRLAAVRREHFVSDIDNGWRRAGGGIYVVFPAGLVQEIAFSNGRYGGGDSLLFDVRIMACSPSNIKIIISAGTAALSDVDIGPSIKYAQVGFHHVIVPAYGCTNVTKTIRVHHASMAAVDHDALLVVSAVIKREGYTVTASDYRIVDVASFIAQLDPV